MPHHPIRPHFARFLARGVAASTSSVTGGRSGTSATASRQKSSKGSDWTWALLQAMVGELWW